MQTQFSQACGDRRTQIAGCGAGSCHRLSLGHAHTVGNRLSLGHGTGPGSSPCTGMAHLRTHANTTQKAKRRSVHVQQLETRPNDASAIAGTLANIQSCPTSQAATRPTPLTCQQRVLLRVALGQTVCDTDPKRPVIAPIPSRRARPRKSLKGRAHAIPLYWQQFGPAPQRARLA
jgi:hypothetical protein